jgi:hypothetical protein
VHQTQAALRVHSFQKRRPIGRAISGSDILQYQKRSFCWNPAGIYIAGVLQQRNKQIDKKNKLYSAA